jgi:thiamine biosynthesis lipoprotein
MNLLLGLVLVSHLYTAHYENVLGTSLELKVSAVSQQASDQAEKAVLGEISRLSKILSAYDPNSEFSRWMRTRNTAVPVSPELYEVLGLFDAWRLRTSGAVDASAEVITRVWKKAAARGSLPAASELDSAIGQVRQQHWTLDPGNRTATHLDDAPLMLNSFAKSYIIRHAAEAALATGGVSGIVVNIGGDLVVAGDWQEPVLVSDPRADAENDQPVCRLAISDRAIATSGNYRRGELIAGHWYSHIVDPRTGQPADGILSATVVAPDATDAGALATAFNVMTAEESQQLAATLPGVDYLILTRDGRRLESAGWNRLETHGNDGAAPGNFELLVNLEINLQKEGFAKRPYVAVWIEDEDHAPVRTIAIWHGSDRYLPELKSWYLKYRGLYTEDKNFNASITSATRSAGKYSVKWDGLDDHGNPVKPGKYILKIEAAREHGTYQLMRQEIVCDDTPKKIDLAGNVEIASASLDYRKK